MIVFVDNEHPTGYDQPWAETLMANRVRITYMLEDLSGHECHLIRWNRVTPELLRDLDARAIFISGNSAQPDEYEPDQQAGLRAAISSMQWPTFGFCGGHQVLGQVFEVPVEPIGELADGEEPFGEAADFAPGAKAEFGYLPIEVNGAHPLLDGLGGQPVFRQAHTWELKALPDGFTNYATTEVTPIQLMIHDELPIVGTQFHPEYGTDEHPDGTRLIANFMRWAKLT
jgi:GMP synthase-like glutamine amidotransferase